MTSDRTRREMIRRDTHDQVVERAGIAAGRLQLAADVRARIHLHDRALTVELSTGPYIHIDDVLALIDEEAARGQLPAGR